MGSKIPLFAVIACCAIAVALAATALWQHNEANSAQDDANRHTSTAALFQSAESEGQAAGTLLQQYVQTGDATLIPQINDHTTSGISQLTAAVEQSGIDGQPFLDGGTALVQGQGQIVALRQSGQVPQAAAGLQQLKTKFDEFMAQQKQVIDGELAAATASQDDSDAANSAQSWLLIGAGFFAICAVAGGVMFVMRSAARRRSAGMATPA